MNWINTTRTKAVEKWKGTLYNNNLQNPEKPGKQCGMYVSASNKSKRENNLTVNISQNLPFFSAH